MAPPNTRDGVGVRISRVRRRLGLFQADFARRIGVTRNTAFLYERGRIPRAETLARIAEAGGVTVEWLLRGRRKDALAADKAFAEAVEALRALWRDPGRRATVRSVLKALRPP